MRGQDPCPAAERSLLRFPSLLRVSALCPEPSAGFPRGPEHNPPSCVPCPRAVTPPPHDGPSSLLSAPGTEEPLAWLALCSRVFPHRLLQDSAVQARVPGPRPRPATAALAALLPHTRLPHFRAAGSPRAQGSVGCLALPLRERS